jgi:hypothetical protein
MRRFLFLISLMSVYLTTLSTVQVTWRQMIVLLVNNELE